MIVFFVLLFQKVFKPFLSSIVDRWKVIVDEDCSKLFYSARWNAGMS